MTWLLWLLLFVALMFLAGDFFSRFTARNMTENPDFVMTCSKGYFLCVFGADVLFLAAAIWSVESAADPPVLLPIVLLMMCLWLSYELAWTLVVRLEFERKNVAVRSVFGGKNNFQANHIQHMAYHPKVRWFSVQLDNGDSIRVSRVMTGLPQFASWIVANVNRSRIEPETSQILEDASGGKLPGIWL